MDLRQHIVDYLKEAKLMQLATIDKNGKPWICSVWFAADEDLNIYWFSSVTREHSKDLKTNKNVAAAMALPHLPEDKPRGLQLRGTAEELDNDEDIKKAKAVYVGRIFDEARVKDMMSHPNRPHKFYRFKPTKFVLFDAVNYPDDPRQELSV